MKNNKWIWLGLDCVWVILLLAFDQYTKLLAVKQLKDQAPIVIWKNVFQLEYLYLRSRFLENYEENISFGSRFSIYGLCLLFTGQAADEKEISGFACTSWMPHGRGDRQYD